MRKQVACLLSEHLLRDGFLPLVQADLATITARGLTLVFMSRNDGSPSLGSVASTAAG